MSEAVLLTHTDTLELIKKAQAGDMQAREKLVESNIALVKSLVRRYMNRGVEYDDLLQIGSLGLIKAVLGFNADYGSRFSTYAVPLILGELKRYMRDDGMIKVSRTLKENSVKMARMIEEYRKEHLCEPTVEQIAQQTGIPPEEVVMSFEAAADVESIYRTVYQGDGSEVCLIDKIEEKRNYNEESVNRMVIAQIMEELPEKERTLIRMRYFEERTQTDIAAKLGISQVQVSRMEKKILASMKKKLA